MNTKSFIQKIKTAVKHKTTETSPSFPSEKELVGWNPARRKRNLIKLFIESAQRVDAVCHLFTFSKSELIEHIQKLIAHHDIKSGIVFMPELLNLNSKKTVWKTVFQQMPELEPLDYELSGINDQKFIQQKLRDVDLAITGCNYLLADTGAALILSGTVSGRLGSLLPPHHLVIANVSQIYHCFSKLLENNEHRDSIEQAGTSILISGPSRTADIEKTLVKGVHGPVSLTYFIIE
jgi:L-lactate utilization protein LutC